MYILGKSNHSMHNKTHNLYPELLNQIQLFMSSLNSMTFLLCKAFSSKSPKKLKIIKKYFSLPKLCLWVEFREYSKDKRMFIKDLKTELFLLNLSHCYKEKQELELPRKIRETYSHQ